MVESGGRQWIAWFTNEIPFQDGPFKFYGLPGLIVKLEDSEDYHKFLLKGNQTIPLTQKRRIKNPGRL